MEFTKKSEITPTELTEMDNFNKSSDNNFSIAGLDLRRMVGVHVHIYISLAQAKTPSVATSAGP